MSYAQDKSVLRRSFFMHRLSDIADFKGQEEIGLRAAAVIAENVGEEFERLSGKSRKQLLRYGADANIPSSVLTAAQAIVGVSADWLLNGIINSRIDLHWHGMYLRLKSHYLGEQLTARNSRPPNASVDEYYQREQDALVLKARFERNEELLNMYEEKYFEPDTDFDWRMAERITAIQPGLNFIPFVDLRFAAGAGLSAADLIPLNNQRLSFTEDELRALGKTSTHGLKAFTAIGDSMTPTIADGAPILVDEQDKRIRDGIFAFRVGNDLRVKRLRPVGIGDLEIRSDNSLYPPEIFTSAQREQLEVAIIGRVIWVGNRL